MTFETLDHWDNNRVVPIVIREEKQMIHKKGDEYFCFSVLVHGHGVFQINDSLLEIAAPAFFCLDNCKSIRMQSTKDVKFLSVYFSPTFLNVNMTPELLHSQQYENLFQRFHFCKLYPFLCQESSSCVLYPDENILEATIQKLVLCSEQLKVQFDFFWSCRARSYLMEVLAFLELMHQNYRIPKSLEVEENPLANSFPFILSYINSHLEKPLTLQSVCSIFGTNRTDLEKIFKDMLGMTFYQYVTNQRIQRATASLRFTELPLAEIAYQSGFSSTQNFCKFFKLKMNVSPNKYRKMQVQERITAMRTFRAKAPDELVSYL